MPTQEAPYRRQNITLDQVRTDTGFSKGWYVKETDEEGSFVIPTRMYFHQIGEHNPIMFIKRAAFFNELENVVLLVQTGYTDRPVITLLHETVAFEYIGCEDK